MAFLLFSIPFFFLNIVTQKDRIKM